MANWYVDPAAVGTNAGTSWVNAFTSLQGFFNTAYAIADFCYCRGTEQPTTALDMIATHAGVFIIGCNSSGVEDGTQYVIDAANISSWGAYNVALQVQISVYLNNIEIKNSAKTAIQTITNGTILTAKNCYIHDNIGLAVAASNSSSCSFEFSTILNNIGGGISSPYLSITACYMANNGSQPSHIVLYAVVGNITHIINNSVIVNNTGSITINNGAVINTVIDGNRGDGLTLSNTAVSIYGCRITNNSGYGIVIPSGQVVFEDGNFINGNTAGPISYPDVYDMISGGLTQYIGNQGYTDRANGNYNLLPEATNRNLQYNIDGTNQFFFSSGLIPAADTVVNPTRSKFYKPMGIWRSRV